MLLCNIYIDHMATRAYYTCTTYQYYRYVLTAKDFSALLSNLDGVVHTGVRYAAQN